MKNQDTKQKLFEMTAKLDGTFKPRLNETSVPPMGGMPMNEEKRPLYQIAKEIRQDWGSKIYFGAVPYLQAMMQLNSIDDMYGMDSAKSIVLYFLANAQTWRGENAKRIKAELKGMAGLKESALAETDEIGDAEEFNSMKQKSLFGQWFDGERSGEGSFTTALLELFLKADASNKNKLQMAFPDVFKPEDVKYFTGE